MFEKEAVPLFDIVIGIRSDAVYGLVVMSSEEEVRPTILFSVEEPIRDYAMGDTEDMFHAMKEALFSATLSLSQNGFKAVTEHTPRAKISHLIIVSGAPFGTTVSRFISLKRETPFHATMDFVRHAVEEANAQTDIQNKEKAVVDELGMRIVNRSILEATLNGYSVTSFTGQSAVELSLAEVTELVSEFIKKTIQETEKNLLPHVPTREHTYAFALSLVLREHFPHSPHILSCDIHAHHSECALIRDGVLLRHSITPFGIFHAAQSLSTSLKTLNAEAYGHLKGFGVTMQHEEVETALATLVEVHAEVIYEQLSDIRTSFVLPKEVIVLTPPDFSAYARAVIERACSKLNTKDTFIVRSFTEDEISAIAERGAAATQSSVTSAVLARFVHIQRMHTGIDNGRIEVY